MAVGRMSRSHCGRSIASTPFQLQDSVRSGQLDKRDSGPVEHLANGWQVIHLREIRAGTCLDLDAFAIAPASVEIEAPRVEEGAVDAIIVCEEGIAHDRVANPCEMDPDLVAPTGEWPHEQECVASARP